MICMPCRRQEHEHGGCLGGTWCDCQHKPVEHFATSIQIRSAFDYMLRTYGPEAIGKPYWAPGDSPGRVSDEDCLCGVGKGHEPVEHGSHCPIRQYYDRNHPNQQTEGVPEPTVNPETHI